jgi:hypothetical protein
VDHTVNLIDVPEKPLAVEVKSTDKVVASTNKLLPKR